MAQNWLITPSSRPGRSLDIVRIVVALVLSVHSIVRMTDGLVGDFGEFLSSVGCPFGVALAWFVTLSTLASSVALVIGRLVIPACICHIIVLFIGILFAHRHSGWFVVGGGRNGMEFSVVLIACLFAVMWSYWPGKQKI